MMKTWKKITIGTVVLLLIAGGVSWAFWSRPDPQLQKVKDMQAELFKKGTMPSPAEREALHKEMEQLTPEQRRAAWDQMRGHFEQRLDKQVAEYFALPKDKRNDYLDKRIAEMQKMRKEMEDRRAQSGQSGPPGGGPGGQNGQAGQSNSSANGPGGAAGGRNMSSDARMLRRDQRLDSVSAEQRASRTLYITAVTQRCKDLGVPPPFGPRPH
jgi:hypothetical protein